MAAERKIIVVKIVALLVLCLMGSRLYGTNEGGSQLVVADRRYKTLTLNFGCKSCLYQRSYCWWMSVESLQHHENNAPSLTASLKLQLCYKYLHIHLAYGIQYVT